MLGLCVLAFLVRQDDGLRAGLETNLQFFLLILGTVSKQQIGFAEDGFDVLEIGLSSHPAIGRRVTLLFWLFVYEHIAAIFEQS